MRKLLIADDDDAVRKLVQFTLESDDVQILHAGDGEEALQLAREHRPELLLLDVMMPKRSGIEVCRALKSDADTSSIAIVMLTARAQESERAEGLDAGADDYFTKPFSPVELINKIDEMLGKS